ncbi:MAG: hypothetical protein K2X81_23650 [Candidatus Obscuribacterales bacterium]|nr:hypothetical protein [Candidatus Obscuribacterales bacterium]
MENQQSSACPEGLCSIENDFLSKLKERTTMPTAIQSASKVKAKNHSNNANKRSPQQK